MRIRRGGTTPVDSSPTQIGFHDPALAARLADDGYAVVGSLLDPAEVEAATGVFDEAMRRLSRPVGDVWFPTILLQDDAVRTFITTELRTLVEPKLEAVFSPEVLELLRLDYSVKPASSQSGLGPHQDFSVIDESAATSYYLWVPLVATDEANGALHVVPESHRFANRIRSQHVPAVFDDVLDLVEDDAVRLDRQAGDLVVMASGVIHFSPPNRSDRVRLAIHGIVKPVTAPLVFFYADDQTPADKVECYEVDIDQYVRHIHHGRPEPGIPLTRLVDRPESSMTRSRFEKGMAKRSRRQ